MDIRVRPIRHRIAKRVRAHIFLCLLAYYVEWHMRRALAPLLFDDAELPDSRRTRDAVAPARPSPSAQKKKTTRLTPEGLPIHSFNTLLAALGTHCHNRCRLTTDPSVPPCYLLTEPTALQHRACELLGFVFPGKGNSHSMDREPYQSDISFFWEELRPKKHGGTDDVANLRLVHHNCHRQIHSSSAPLGVRRWLEPCTR
jgi:hypothetical protein